MSWTIEDWAQVLFCDETSIQLFMERRTQDYVWRKADEEFHPDCINYQKRPQGIGLMFWRVFRKGKMSLEVFFSFSQRRKGGFNYLSELNFVETTLMVLEKVF